MPKKKASPPEIAEGNQDFQVAFASKYDDDTVVLTGAEMTDKWLSEALQHFDPSNKQYSAYLSDSSSNNTLTTETINTLADGAQSNLQNILQINAIVRKEINANDIIGKVANSIEDNVNSEYKLTYKNFAERRNKTKQLEKVKQLIDDFNTQINLESIIRKSIPNCYNEGTYIMYLRNKDSNWIVDTYPLGVGVISDYEVNGKPVVLINMNELKSKLSKTMLKSKKGKYLFFENTEKEIQANYPPEVYAAFRDKDDYAVLDVNYTGVIRIGNMGRKYGLSPIFRSLKDVLMLDVFASADETNTKARAKKIIHQILRKEAMGQSYDRKAFEEMAYAHENFMRAFRNNTVAYTSIPAVEKIVYVEPKAEVTNSESINLYRSKVLTSLGIGFLSDTTQTVSTAKISLDQLMLTINKISEQLEDVIEGWYRALLSANGISLEFCPTIKILDSEMMSYELRQSLSGFVYNTLGASRETAYKMVGLSIENEYQQRLIEKEAGYDEVFTPYGTAYTKSSSNDVKNKAGRPADEDSQNPDKQEYDDNYNEDGR